MAGHRNNAGDGVLRHPSRASISPREDLILIRSPSPMPVAESPRHSGVNPTGPGWSVFVQKCIGFLGTASFSGIGKLNEFRRALECKSPWILGLDPSVGAGTGVFDGDHPLKNGMTRYSGFLALWNPIIPPSKSWSLTSTKPTSDSRLASSPVE